MKKRVSSLMLAAVLAAMSVTACSGGKEAGTTPVTTAAAEKAAEETKSEQQTAETPAPTEEKAADGSVDLTVTMPLGQWTDNFDILIDRWQSYMEEMKRTGEACGVEFALGHAVVYDFCSGTIDREYYDSLMERCILGAEILGIAWLVLHPSTMETERFLPDKPESKKANLAFFQKWGNFALDHGVGLAVEGMWDSTLDVEAKYAISVDELIDRRCHRESGRHSSDTRGGADTETVCRFKQLFYT